MPERMHYPHAPIVEAIIDFAVTQRRELSVEELLAIQDIVADRYPTKEDEYTYSGQVSVPRAGDPAEFDSVTHHSGFRLISADKQQVFYVRRGGFAFAVHAPYDRWESFRDEAHRLWDVYRSFTEVESVTRAAVRYINRIDIPDTDPIKLEDYLQTYPEVSRDLPYEGLMRNFFMQLQMWQEDLRCMLIINESPAPPPDQSTSSILLDFDFFREQFEEPWSADDDTAVWQFLEKLHDRKNEVFEASITPRTRRLIS